MATRYTGSFSDIVCFFQDLSLLRVVQIIVFAILVYFTLKIVNFMYKRLVGIVSFSIKLSIAVAIVVICYPLIIQYLGFGSSKGTGSNAAYNYNSYSRADGVEDDALQGNTILRLIRQIFSGPMDLIDKLRRD